MSVKIDQALIQHFINGNFGIGIAHENQIYSPVVGTPYAEISVIQNDITPVDLSFENETDGIFRIVLHYQADTGAVEAKLMADTIFAYFDIGETISYNGQSVWVSSHHRYKGAVEQGWYKIIMTIGYQAYIRR